MEILGKNVGELIPGLSGNSEQTKEINETPEYIPPSDESKIDSQTDSAQSETKDANPYSDLLKDDFVKGFLDSYFSNDDSIESLLEGELHRVKNSRIDYNSMSDEEVVRAALRKEYPDLSGAALEKVINKHFSQFGDLSDFDEDDEDYASEKQIRDANLKREADKYRKQLIEEQSKFKRKNAEEIKSELTSKQEAMAKKQMEEIEKWEKMVTGDGFISNVLESGEIKVGKAENEFGFKVKDVDKFKKALTNDPDFFSLFSTGNEKNPVDFKRWAKVVAYALDPEGFESMLLVNGKNAGTGKILDELENPVKPNSPQASSPSTLAESLLGAISKRR